MNNNNNQEQNSKSDAAIREEKVLRFWKENNIFKKTLKKDSPMGEFVFYDGPPYATGIPHYGHLLPGTIKDVIPRYKTMKGFSVPRRWGWDCHGLPIENLIQKELDLPTKQDIVEFGIEKFNAAARDSVLRYEESWKEYIPRVGRFVDMDYPYMTMTPDFMESVWWVFKELHNKGLVYKGYKSMMVSPLLETVLSNQEVNMGGYKDVTDMSVTTKFTLKDGEHAGAHVLAWTTTPWTLPGNVLLAVGKGIDYVKVSSEEETYIAGKELAEKVFEGKEYTVESELKGSDLVGSTYEPVFPYYQDHANAFRIVAADFVTTEDGTGIVHIAPGFGQDDLELGQKEGVEPIQHVQMDGHFVPEVEKSLVEEGYDVAGWAVKNTKDHMHVDVEMVKYLAHHGKLFSKKKYVHSYPMCWRTDCPLINYATDSWFINVQKIKDQLIANNKKTKWVPEHVRDGRFGNWLEDVRDWSVSRSRFWGTPLPIWQNEETKEYKVLGSVEDLREYAGDAVTRVVFVRHGESIKNVENRMSSAIDKHPLTEKGEKVAKLAGDRLQEFDVDVIYSSPVLRAKQTAEIIGESLDIEINFDNRIREIENGEWEEKTLDEIAEHGHREEYLNLPIEDRYKAKRGKTGESWEDIENRLRDFLDDVQEKHRGKTIVVVSHMGTNTMGMKILKKLTNHQVDAIYENPRFTAHATPIAVHTSSDTKREIDLHRPFIDDVVLTDADGSNLKRVEDVFDVWFDSGSMPYAQQHHMGQGDKAPRFPADFIAEGQDQTRGWFYVLSVLGTALFNELPFKQVVVNGMVLAEDGKKMSKRLKNYPELDFMLDKYGADAVRLFLMASPAVHAEDVNFVEKSVSEVQSKVMGRLRNVVEFYKMYEEGEDAKAGSDNILDKWILARLSQAADEMGRGLEGYEIDKGARQIFDFVDDLSTWYVRRSRDRFKSEGEDKARAIETTRFVLREFSKLIAPYIPFVADEVYKDVAGSLESVHLENWPVLSEKKSFLGKIFNGEKSDVLGSMKATREVVKLGLEARQKAGIKARQPLAGLQITEKLDNEYVEVLKDELNIKNISVGSELVLDTDITPELQKEGNMRDLLREVQKMRKEAGLNPEDKIKLTLPEEKKDIYESFTSDFQNIAGVAGAVFGGEIKIDKM
jgi:isoleucyl-tRNA synthetase